MVSAAGGVGSMVLQGPTAESVREAHRLIESGSTVGKIDVER